MRLLSVLLACLAACTVDDATDRSGIAVGNPPGKEEVSAMARVTVADGIDVEMVDFLMAVDAVHLEDCFGQGQRIDLPVGTALRLDGSSIPIPTGEWCVVGLLPSPRAAHLRGFAGRGRFRFESTLGRVLLYSDPGVVLLEDDELVLELGEPGWLEAADFDVLDGEERFVGGPDCLDDTLCSRIRGGLMNRAGLFRDRDRNGQVDDTERKEGTDAAGDSRRERTRTE